MNDYVKPVGLSPDQRRLLQQLLQESIFATEARLRELSIEPGALLDTEAPIQNQVVQLRNMFLLGEKAAVKFAPDDANHWRVVRARLQPIVLAYQTHERFVQSVLTGIDPKNDDALMAIYKDRLQNSERFRDIFFELDKRVKSTDFVSAEDGDVQNNEFSESHGEHKNNYRTEDDTASIQNNVLTQLSKQIKELEKREQEQIKALQIKDRELAAIVGERDRTLERMGKLESELARIREESINLRLAADAAMRTGSGNDPEGLSIPDLISIPDDVPSRSAAANTASDAGDDAYWEKRVDELQAEVASMSSAAYNAYMASSDMSIVILFMLSSFQANTYDRLGSEIVRTVSTYGVKPTVSIMTDTGPKYFSGAQPLPNANTMIESRRSRGKIVEDGAMLLIYEERVVLLIPDMPVKDRARCDRLRDNLTTLIKGASARADAVGLATAAEKQKVQMERLLVKSDDVFKGINKNLEKQQLRLMKLLQLASQDLRGGLGITPGDPKSITLTGRIKKLEDSLRGLFNPDELMDPAFTKNVAKVAANLKEK